MFSSRWRPTCQRRTGERCPTFTQGRSLCHRHTAQLGSVGARYSCGEPYDMQHRVPAAVMPRGTAPLSPAGAWAAATLTLHGVLLEQLWVGNGWAGDVVPFSSTGCGGKGDSCAWPITRAALCRLPPEHLCSLPRLYLSLVLGNVNVTLLSKQAKYGPAALPLCAWGGSGSPYHQGIIDLPRLSCSL